MFTFYSKDILGLFECTWNNSAKEGLMNFWKFYEYIFLFFILWWNLGTMFDLFENDVFHCFGSELHSMFFFSKHQIYYENFNIVYVVHWL